MKKHTYITNEIIDKYVEMYHSGKTITEISKITNTNEQTVSRYLRQRGEYVEQISKYKVKIICDLYESGLSEEAVGERVSLCRTTVRRVLKRNGVQIRKQEETSKRYPLNEHYFDNIDTPNKAYILGFIYADGNVDDKSLFQISLQERDLHILESMKREFGCPDRPLIFDARSKKNENHKNMFMLSIKNKEFRNGLVKHGVIPRKTHEIKYPDFLPASLDKHFIRGLLDGDGCIHGTEVNNKQNSNVDIIGTRELCVAIADILNNELSIHCSIVDVHNKDTNTYRVTISGRLQCVKFLDWLYVDADMFLYRKYETYLSKYKYAM